MSHLTLIPAYGRDYKSKAEVLADWFADRDFFATGYGGGGYINRPQVACDVNIRYDQNRKVVVIKLGTVPPKPKAPKVKANPERKRVKRDGIATTAEVYHAQVEAADKVTLRNAYDYESEEGYDADPR